MKKSKLILLWVLTFAAGLVCGGWGFYAWEHASAGSCGKWTRCDDEYSLRRSYEFQKVNPFIRAELIKDGELPTDVKIAEEENLTPKSSADLPSQLVRSDLPEDVVLGGEAAPTEEKTSGVVLSDGQNTVVLNSQKPAQRAADGTSITMIEAPVTVKRIKTLDDYKAFKRTALGSYPAADFATEEVVVLESQSNLPDKVFEIVSVDPDGENLKLRYRVNVFGLDKKTNTHSAQKINKTKANIILEQVL